MNKNITTVIFDWGGVLITNPPAKIAQYVANYFKVSVEKAIEAWEIVEDPFGRGELSENKMWEKYCSHLEVPTPTIPSLYYDAFKHAYEEQPIMFDLADKLKREGYKVGFLSNTEAPAEKFFHTRGYNKLFDVTVFSCSEGIRKPESEIYKLALSRLGSLPEETIFIDDREDYCRGAQSCGIHTIQCISPDQVKTEINKILSI